MTKRKRNLLIAGGILAGAVGISALLVARAPDRTRSTPVSRTPLVATAAVEAVSGPLMVSGSGTVRPRERVDLAPQVGGEIVEIARSLVSGGRVERGELLVRIEDADYRNAVEQARAQVAQDEVAVLQAEQEARIAREEYGQFLRRRGGAEAVDSARLTSPASALALRRPQLEAARAALARSRAQLADAELALSRTRVRAPFDAVVLSESVDRGALASPGAPLATLYASDAVEVVVALTDEQAALIPGLWELRAGDDARPVAATVTAPYGRDRFGWEGFVDRAEASLDEESRTVDVVVRVPDPFRPGRPVEPGTDGPAPATAGAGSGASSASHPARGAGRGLAASPASTDAAPPGGTSGVSDPGIPVATDTAGGAWDDAPRSRPPLLVGQFADVRIEGPSGRYLRIPRRALRTDDEVWVVREGEIRIVPVRVIQREDARVYVSGALSPGDRVVTEGLGVATEGMAVELRDRPEGS